MKTNKYIVAGIVAAVLMTSGCGKFVRDELITMQNEIDLLYGKVDQMNKSLASLKGIVEGMAARGYIVDVREIEDDERGGYTLVLRSVTFDDNGNVATDDSYTIHLYSGVDGIDGEDAAPFVVGVRQDEEDGRWYRYDTRGGEWLLSADGTRFLVDGKDGKTPLLRVDDGFWSISWDGGQTWEATEWPAKGKDAEEVFSKVDVFDDRIELTLASDSTVLTLLRYLPVGVSLDLYGQELPETVPILPGETQSIHYELTGTGAEAALLVAGTDGRFKTAIRQDTVRTKGTVDVICPEVFPEDGYIYITVNDGNGRALTRVIPFSQRRFKILYGETEYAAPAGEEKGRTVTFETNCPLVVTPLFPEGVEPWLNITVEEAGGFTALKYDILANPAETARTGVIAVCPKDHPGFELARITITQAGKPAENPGEGGQGSGEGGQEGQGNDEGGQGGGEGGQGGQGGQGNGEQ